MPPVYALENVNPDANNVPDLKPFFVKALLDVSVLPVFKQCLEITRLVASAASICMCNRADMVLIRLNGIKPSSANKNYS